jgi:beta-lactamase class A
VGLSVAAAACGDAASTSAESTRPAVTSTTPSSTSSTTTTAPTTTTTRPQPATEAALRQIVDEFVAAGPVDVSVIVRDLQRGTAVEHQPDREVWSASLYKLFVARELLRQIADGELDRQAQAGDGSGRTWDQCLRDMIVVSDDPCGVAGIDHVGRGALDASLAGAGYPGTHLDNPQRTTATDVAAILTATYDGTLLGPDRPDPARELHRHLTDQQVNDRLSPGLPEGTPFAHKTGDRTGWAHDAGIVSTSTGDYLVVVLAGPYPAPCCHAEAPGPAEAAAFAAFADLGARLSQAFALPP